MSSSFAQKIRSEIPEEVKFYGIEPQNSATAAMFVLRTKNGRREAYPYAGVRFSYEPDGSMIVIQTYEETIVIKGRNLVDVFEYLAAHRIKYIQEDFSGIDTEETKMFIESIEVAPKIFTAANDNG